jgi:hypothetical protein
MLVVVVLFVCGGVGVGGFGGVCGGDSCGYSDNVYVSFVSALVTNNLILFVVYY